MKGKAIYKPAGKAGEYAEWACNFYKGCSNGCTYCYLKKGVLAHAMGGDKPELKACFKDEQHALEVFGDELILNLSEIREHGLFFSFTTDPLIVRTKRLTIAAVKICNLLKVPVKVLTKCADYWYLLGMSNDFEIDKSLIAIGTTLTGHDELEPNASPNRKRIDMLLEASKAGFKTFASIEPIIDFDSSLEMICNTIEFCDLYRIGLESGKKYDKQETYQFMKDVVSVTEHISKVYFKDSLLVNAGVMTRDVLPKNCVDRNYNLFK
jgi:DNA repair photolyase